MTSEDLMLGMNLPEYLDLGFEISDDGDILSVFDLESGEIVDIYTIH